MTTPEPAKFQPLPEAQRAQILPIAQQFNKWIVSLIDTIAADTSNAADQKTLQALKSAMSAVTTLKPTVPFEHFAFQVSDCIEVVFQDTERFITQMAPSIAYVQKMGITPAKWQSYSEQTRKSIMTHVETLGEMCCELYEFQEATSLAISAQPQQVSMRAGIPSELFDQIKTMLPPQLVAQVSQIPGGLDGLVAQALKQNPALAAMLSNMGDTDPDVAEAAAATGGSGLLPLAGLGAIFESLKSRLTELPDDATPAQKNDFYVSIAVWLGEQMQTEGTVVHSLFGRFEQAFPNGLTRREIDSWIERGRALLKVMGLEKRDVAWTLVRRLTTLIDKMQEETKNSKLTRDTVATKVVSLVRLASDSDGGFEGLFELAMQSEVLKQLVSKFTGMPLAEVTKDPFSAVKAAGASAGPSFDMSSIMSVFAGGATPGGPDDDDFSDDDDDK